MSLPDLPGPFGNNALRDFYEILPPDAINWMPQTKGWLLVLFVLSFFLLRLVIRKLKAWHADRYRREAARRLRDLQDSAVSETFLAELNALLKLTAIAAYSREQVAALSGESWPAFLNAQCFPQPFATQHQQWLATGPYTLATPSSSEQRDLLTASKLWIDHHKRHSNA